MTDHGAGASGESEDSAAAAVAPTPGVPAAVELVAKGLAALTATATVVYVAGA